MQLRVKSVGNTNPSGRGMNGNVFDSDYLCPTLTTNKGEGIKILIKNATKKGYLIAEDGDGIDLAYPESKTRRGRVQKNMAHTITTDDSKCVVVGTIYANASKRFQRGIYKDLSRTIKASNHDLSVVIAASRGRDPKNPSDRKAGNINLEQRLEFNKQGTSNTITTVQKDNYVVEPTIIDDTQGFDGVRTYDNYAPSLRASRSGLKTTEPKVLNPLKGKTENGWHFEQQVYDDRGITRTVKAGGGSGNIPKTIDSFRIRKLTPKECWRLMGCSDEDFEKAEQVNSNTQLYRQAGNAIVVDVLEAIFSQLFIERGSK